MGREFVKVDEIPVGSLLLRIGVRLGGSDWEFDDGATAFGFHCASEVIYYGSQRSIFVKRRVIEIDRVSPWSKVNSIGRVAELLGAELLGVSRSEANGDVSLRFSDARRILIHASQEEDGHLNVWKERYGDGWKALPGVDAGDRGGSDS